MFPMDQLVRMVQVTTAKLTARGTAPTSAGEVLKFLGVTILATRYEFGARADLWATIARNNYMLAPGFGERTGMPRHRYDALWSCLSFSAQEGDADDFEKSRWQLITDFVASINAHRAAHVTPRDLICEDESTCKWYGQEGHWIQRGLPMYVAIDRKPENGCEIQNAACGRSGIMLNLSVVTTAEYRKDDAESDEDDLPHGVAVLKKLVAPWAGTTRVVCADSYFGSVAAARHLLGMGLRFIGVVKTATRGYPVSTLSTLPLEDRGEHVAYVHKTADGVVDMVALLWVDRDRRYFISTASTTLPGAPYERIRWRQVGAHAQRVVLTIPQPQVVETYFECCAQVDRHNRCRQDDLRLENKLVTHDWSMRVNLSLLGMCVVDTWLLYSGAHGTGAKLTQNQFYEDLAAELIDNTYDSVGLRPRSAPDGGHAAVAEPPRRYGVGIHLTPTLKRRAGASANEADQCAQRRCRICLKGRTTHVCSACRDLKHVDIFCCGPKTGRSCFDVHLREAHDLDV